MVIVGRGQSGLMGEDILSFRWVILSGILLSQNWTQQTCTCGLKCPKLTLTLGEAEAVIGKRRRVIERARRAVGTLY